MNPKTTRLWLLLAGGLFAFIFLHHRYATKGPIGPRRPIADLRAAEVTAILVRTQGEAQIRAVLTNGTWRLAEPISDVANTPAIQKLIQALDLVTVAGYIAPAELGNAFKAGEEYGFSPEQSSLSVQQREHKLPLLKIGRRTNPGDQVFVQVAGDLGIYLVDSTWLDLMPRSANAWRDPALVNLTNIAFDRITVNSRGASLVLQIDPNHYWHMVAPIPSRADNPRILEGLLRLHFLRINQFLPDSPKPELESLGLAPPELEIGLNQGPTNVALLQFGKTNDTGQVYARRVGRDALFAVPAEMIAQWWRATVNDFRDQRLLDLTAKIEVVEIRGGEDSFSVQQKTNGAWRVLPQNFPADSRLVGEMLSNLTNMPIAGFKEDVVSDPLLPGYRLAPPMRRVLVFGAEYRADGTNGLLADVSFGMKEGQSYALRGDEAPNAHIYTINTNDFARLPAASWQLRERRFWAFSTNDIAGVIIHQSGKTRQMSRKGPYQWSMVSQGQLNDLAIEEIVRGLSEVEAVAWVGRGNQNRPRFGFVSDGLTVTVELKNGQKPTVEFGGAAPSGMHNAGVTLEGDFWMFEFPPALYEQVVGYLSIPPSG